MTTTTNNIRLSLISAFVKIAVLSGVIALVLALPTLSTLQSLSLVGLILIIGIPMITQAYQTYHNLKVEAFVETHLYDLSIF